MAGGARHELAAAGITDPRLAASYLHCRELNAHHGKTYYLATWLLPPAKRPYVHALYGFARAADDIVDGVHAPDRADRFAAWSADFLADLDWGDSADPVCRAVIDTIARWQLPIDYFADFLDAMRADLTVDAYDTFDDLARYMWGSAAVIGLEMLPILGRADDETRWDVLEPYAVDLGMAFQLTNFIRDIGEDLDRRRIYLPQESLRAFGVDDARLRLAARAGHADQPIRNLLAHEIERARGFYQRAEPGIDLVHPTSRDCLRVATTLYREILDGIEGADYDVFSRRVSVGQARRARVAAGGLVGAWSARRADSPGGPATPTDSTSGAPGRIRTARLRPARTRFARR